MSSTLVVFNLTKEQNIPIELLPQADITILIPHMVLDDLASLQRWMIDTRLNLDELKEDSNFVYNSSCLIIMECTPKRVAAMIMIVMALNLIQINPDIWISTEKKGVYISVRDFTISGEDWAKSIHEKQREHAAVELLNESIDSSNLEENQTDK